MSTGRNHELPWLAKPLGLHWRARSNCLGIDPDFFHPPRGANKQVAECRAICAGCTVRQDCADYAMADPFEERGVWAGATAQERKFIRNGRITWEVVWAKGDALVEQGHDDDAPRPAVSA